MPAATLVFFDGEVAEGDVDTWGFHGHAVRFTYRAGNTMAGDIGLGGIKYVVYSAAPPGAAVGRTLERRLAVHFNDHEVVRAYAGPDLVQTPHGTVLEMEDPDRESRQIVGIPYISVKAIFEIREWDSRVALFEEQMREVSPRTLPRGRDSTSLGERLRREAE
jgi:hypothetical protein